MSQWTPLPLSRDITMRLRCPCPLRTAHCPLRTAHCASPAVNQLLTRPRTPSGIMPRVLRALALAAVLAIGLSHPAGAASLPPIKHVWVVVLENKDYEQTFGKDSPAPYLAKTLT